MAKETIASKNKRRLEAVKNAKTYKGEWYTVNSIFGNDWAIFYILLGGREAGKSYSAMRWGVINKLKKGEDFKFYWFRLTEAAVKKLLADDGIKFIDPDIARKFGVKTLKRGDSLYTYKTITNEKGKTDKTDIKLFADILACSTFYNTKGVGYFDSEFKGTYYLVLDEMNREESEANRFDIIYNFVNLCENIVRSTKVNLKVLLIGNTLDEASDILAAFNFIPADFGRYKLKRKRAVIDYIKPSEEYKKRREGTIADILLPDASTFTNEIEIDRELLTGKRVLKPTLIVKFTKKKSDWFTLWDGEIIMQWNGEDKQAIPMRRYLDETYSDENMKYIYDRYDARGFKYKNLATYKRFEKQLKLLKKI